MNAIELTGDSILLATAKSVNSVKYIDGTLQITKKIKFKDLGYGIICSTCFHQGYGDRKNFIVSFGMADIQDCPNTETTYQGSNRNGYNSFITNTQWEEST